ncbi:MAG TPA: VacJ family lipoprotein [Desulfobacteraceae bacterium]|nr:VacJ family lipoprotein [Desulfobacteraceae bacterium]
MKQLIAVLLVGCALVCFSPVDGFTGDTAGVATDEALPEEVLLDDEDLFAEYETQGQATQAVADPLYYFNYAMFSVNDVLYFYALKPVAQGYKAVVPTVARKGISNFFNNLMFPIRFANNILQGKGERAANELGAFVVNSTVGVLGFYDFAQRHMDINLPDEDLGQTLGVYGIGDGFYLVLPLLGPSTLRDTVGRLGDSFANPITYVEPWELAWGMRGLDQVNTVSFRIGDYEALKEASLDPYVALRNAYIQNRKSLIKE